MKTIIRDASYWYEVYGEGDVIVLLHGFTGSTVTWSTFIENYQDQFQIIVIDLPGHGKTITPSPVTMEQCCHDIHHLLQKNNIDKYHLIGYSMGGRTALTYAMYYLDELKSLILESASPGLELDKDREERITNDEKLALKIENEGLEAFVNFWENIPLFQTQKKLPRSSQIKVRNERLAQTVEGLAMSLRFMGTGAQPSWWEQLSNLAIPVLLIVGELDIKFVEINKRMQKSLPNCNLNIVENAGHAIHVESQVIFGKTVEEFIFSVSGT